ncbi:MAG TPA: hypothetical protein H9884_05580 [Candidatus Yaniella excrementigallinarum]|nr:hypothetical protein [Candidatus Yaniella excrementigallinarum]
MSKPAANLGAALNRKKAEKPKDGGVASTFRRDEGKAPMKKATYEIPQELHRALNLHAVSTGVPMRDLVVKYIAEGLREDDVKY